MRWNFIEVVGTISKSKKFWTWPRQSFPNRKLIWPENLRDSYFLMIKWFFSFHYSFTILFPYGRWWDLFKGSNCDRIYKSFNRNYEMLSSFKFNLLFLSPCWLSLSHFHNRRERSIHIVTGYSAGKSRAYCIREWYTALKLCLLDLHISFWTHCV